MWGLGPRNCGGRDENCLSYCPYRDCAHSRQYHEQGLQERLSRVVCPVIHVSTASHQKSATRLIARDDHANCRLHRHRRFDRISAGQAMTAADYAILGVLVAVPLVIVWYALRQHGLY